MQSWTTSCNTQLLVRNHSSYYIASSYSESYLSVASSLKVLNLYLLIYLEPFVLVHLIIQVFILSHNTELVLLFYISQMELSTWQNLNRSDNNSGNILSNNKYLEYNMLFIFTGAIVYNISPFLPHCYRI